MLLKVTVNGQDFFVDAPNKGSAKAYGKKQLKVEVTELSLADLQNVDVSTVVKVEVAEKKEAAPAEGAAAGVTASGDKTTY